MGFFNSLFSRPTPPAGNTPQTTVNGPRKPATRAGATQGQSAQPVAGTRHYYEALSETNDRTNIPAYTLNALKYAVKGLSRERLAALGEYLYDNDGLVGYAVDTVANYSVPIMPMAATADPEANTAYEDYWCEWCKRADFTGRHDFNTLQRLACKAIDIHGEIAPAMTSEGGFPQIQLVETYHITSRRLVDADGLNLDGVSIDGKGRVLGFFVVQGPDSTPVFVPANAMLLVYDPERYSNYRGYSPARRGMNDIRDAKDIKGYEKLATKIGAALAAVLEGSDFEQEDVWGADSQDPAAVPQPSDADAPADTTGPENNISLMQLLGGDIPVLPDGKQLHQLDNNRPGERVMELLDYLGGCYAFGLGLPPAFLIDAKLTGPNQRSVNGKAQRKFDQRQGDMARFVEWCWVRVIGWGIDHDGLPAVDGWQKMEWQGPSKVSIDEGKDADAWRKDVQSGLMTRQQHYGNRALNWKRETDQGFIEDDYILTKAQALASKHGVDVEVILNRWGYTAAQPDTQPAADQTTPNETDPTITD